MLAVPFSCLSWISRDELIKCAIRCPRCHGDVSIQSQQRFPRQNDGKFWSNPSPSNGKKNFIEVIARCMSDSIILFDRESNRVDLPRLSSVTIFFDPPSATFATNSHQIFLDNPITFLFVLFFKVFYVMLCCACGSCYCLSYRIGLDFWLCHNRICWILWGTCQSWASGRSCDTRGFFAFPIRRRFWSRLHLASANLWRKTASLWWFCLATTRNSRVDYQLFSVFLLKYHYVNHSLNYSTH